MTQESRITEFEEAVNLLLSEGMTKDQAYSVIIKLWYLFQEIVNKPTTIKHQKTSLEELFTTLSEPWVDFIEEFEFFKVSKIWINIEVIFEVGLFLRKRFRRAPTYKLKDDKKLKKSGFYITPNWIDNSITNQVKNDIKKSIRFTTIDFSAGLGDFLKPFIVIEQSINYAVELDPHNYESMIFSYLMNSSVSKHQKMKLMLTVKQGDSLLGYQKNVLDKLLNVPEHKELLINYLNTRLEILDRESNYSLKHLKESFRLRREIAELDVDYCEFNWYIDFPEIFMDTYGEELKDFGIDYVVGNPPWIKYSQANFKKYAEILKDSGFNELIQGKFNFYLPFTILAFKLTKKIGGLVLPQAILTETYAQKFREYIFKTQTIYQIKLYGSKGFRQAINEFCTIVWNKKEEAKFIDLTYYKKRVKSKVGYDSIKAPFYRLPLLPAFRIFDTMDISRNFGKLDDYIVMRRGFTLTGKYQEKYREDNIDSKDKRLKKIIKNSIFTKDIKKGVFNFQTFYSGDKFIYDKDLLGASGSEKIFERSKIIRRNRGRKWLIGLDLNQNLYVNDIFDIIYMKDDRISLKAMFGYLSSSFIQLMAEGYLQRDITSNTVRELPIPDFQTNDLKQLEHSVDNWIASTKTLSDFRKLRLEVDELLSNICDFSIDLIGYLKHEVEINWKEL